MAQKKVNPKIEWGFFAVVPRVVRTQYKDLTHSDKWLYTCLKDLCGDKGTCFRTLRALKEETDISIASLSTMIPKLHEAGLIHAEKKRRSNSGKEVWHITIVDIWQLNKDFCSAIEQSKDEIVQQLNNNVQQLNKEAEVCSDIERDCSNFGYRRTTLEEEHIEERTIEDGGIATSLQEDRNAPIFAFQIQNFPLHFYHDFCIHAQDRGINDDLTLIVRNLADVPDDAECDICYKLVHDAHGYFEIGKDDAPVPINLEVAKKKRETNPRMLALSVSHSQRLSETSEEEEEDEPTVKVPITKMKGNNEHNPNTRDNTTTHADRKHDWTTLGSEDDSQSLQDGRTSADRSNPQRASQRITTQQPPGAGTRSLAVTPKGDGQDDSTSDQASLTLASGIPARHSGHSPGNSPASPDAVQGGNSPPMALTARQIKAQNERREKELWAIIEDGRGTTYSATQRRSPKHTTGIAGLIEDDVSNEAIRAGLRALSAFERQTFTVNNFYDWLPNLSAKAPVRSKTKGTPTARPTLDEVECIDPTWCVYQRPGDDQEWILWQGELCTPEEADERGYAGGGGLYIQTQYA